MINARKNKAEALGIKRYCKGRADKVKGILGEFYDGDDLQTALGDLLSDILHFCNVNNLDFNEVYNKGYYHFAAERNGGQHG